MDGPSIRPMDGNPPKLNGFLHETLTLQNVLGMLGVLNVLHVPHVLHVLNMPMDASLVCWALLY